VSAHSSRLHRGWPRAYACTQTRRAFPVKLIGDEGKRCAAYRLLFARRFAKRALSSRRRAVPQARDKQIGSDCDARTSVSQRVQFETPFYVIKGLCHSRGQRRCPASFGSVLKLRCWPRRHHNQGTRGRSRIGNSGRLQCSLRRGLPAGRCVFALTNGGWCCRKLDT